MRTSPDFTPRASISFQRRAMLSKAHDAAVRAQFNAAFDKLEYGFVVAIVAISVGIIAAICV